MHLLHISKTKRIPGSCAEYRNVVTADGQGFVVSQQDIENGRVWNTTPVRNFDSFKDACSFADSE